MPDDLDIDPELEGGEIATLGLILVLIGVFIYFN